MKKPQDTTITPSDVMYAAANGATIYRCTKDNKNHELNPTFIQDWGKYNYYIGNKSLDGLTLQDFLNHMHTYKVVNSSNVFYTNFSAYDLKRHFLRYPVTEFERCCLCTLQPIDINNCCILNKKIEHKSSGKIKYVIGIAGLIEGKSYFVIANKLITKKTKQIKVDFVNSDQLFKEFCGSNPLGDTIGEYKSAFKSCPVVFNNYNKYRFSLLGKKVNNKFVVGMSYIEVFLSESPDIERVKKVTVLNIIQNSTI